MHSTTSGNPGWLESMVFMMRTTVTKANGDLPWIGKTTSASTGLVLLMFENYSTQLIWKLLHQNKSIQKGLKRLAFSQIE